MADTEYIQPHTLSLSRARFLAHILNFPLLVVFQSDQLQTALAQRDEKISTLTFQLQKAQEENADLRFELETVGPMTFPRTLAERVCLCACVCVCASSETQARKHTYTQTIHAISDLMWSASPTRVHLLRRRATGASCTPGSIGGAEGSKQQPRAVAHRGAAVTG